VRVAVATGATAEVIGGSILGCCEAGAVAQGTGSVLRIAGVSFGHCALVGVEVGTAAYAELLRCVMHGTRKAGMQVLVRLLQVFDRHAVLAMLCTQVCV
jgi:hypothetical protein